jgi:hypothetical protein
MSYEQPLFKPSNLKAAVDLSAAGNQFKGLKLSGAGAVDISSVAGTAIIGVLQNKPLAGEAAEVMTAGITKAQADAAITVNAEVSVSADGQFKTAVSGEVIVGVALEAAGAAGEIFALLLRNGGVKP